MSLSSYRKDKVCKLYIDSLSVEAFCQQQCALIELKPVQHVTDYTTRGNVESDMTQSRKSIKLWFYQTSYMHVRHGQFAYARQLH